MEIYNANFYVTVNKYIYCLLSFIDLLNFRISKGFREQLGLVPGTLMGAG